MLKVITSNDLLKKSNVIVSGLTEALASVKSGLTELQIEAAGSGHDSKLCVYLQVQDILAPFHCGQGLNLKVGLDLNGKLYASAYNLPTPYTVHNSEGDCTVSVLDEEYAVGSKVVIKYDDFPILLCHYVLGEVLVQFWQD